VYAGDTINVTLKAVSNTLIGILFGAYPWTLTASDVTPGHTFTMTQTFATTGAPFPQAFGGVLEAYNRYLDGEVIQCADYPPATVTFSNVIAGQQFNSDRTSVQAVPKSFGGVYWPQWTDCGYEAQTANIGWGTNTNLNTCLHAICAAGTPLGGSCDSCASTICAQDSYCCTNWWDEICVSEVGSICSQACNASVLDYGAGCNRSATQCQLLDQNGQNPTTMHCCPGGTGMEGIYAGSDSFLCGERPFSFFQGANGQNASGNERSNCVWRGTAQTVQGDTMLACNQGEYMIGFSSSLNRVGCCPYPAGTVTERVDGVTQLRQAGPLAVGGNACQSLASLHTCNFNGFNQGELMTGLHVTNNWLICSKQM
jgi:hypothetical protein